MGRHVFWRSSHSTGHAGGLRAGMQVHVAGRGGGLYLGMTVLHTWGVRRAIFTKLAGAAFNRERGGMCWRSGQQHWTRETVRPRLQRNQQTRPKRCQPR